MPLIKTSGVCVRLWWACVCVCVSMFLRRRLKTETKNWTENWICASNCEHKSSGGKAKFGDSLVTCVKSCNTVGTTFTCLQRGANQIWHWKWLSGTLFYLTDSIFSASHCLLLSQNNYKSFNQTLTCSNSYCTLQSRVWYGIVSYCIILYLICYFTQQCWVSFL